MARPGDLVPGNCYFTVHYFDDDLLLPSVDTLIYRGVGEYDDGGTVWIFDRPDSAEADGPGIPMGFPDEQLYSVLEIDALRTKLAELSTLHPLSPPTKSDERLGMSDAARDELRLRIREFLDEPECVSVTITILYTDDGLSIGRCPAGGYELDFFAHPKLDDEDEKILRMFSSRGIDPHVDYLADKGRTRILKFALVDDVDAIVDMCVDLFTEVHRMRANDALRYSSHRKGDLVPPCASC